MQVPLYPSGRPVIYPDHPPTEMLEIVHEHQRPGMVVAEIGVAEGHTSKHVIHYVTRMKGHMYSVDWFQGNLEVNDPENPHGYNLSSEIVDFKYKHYHDLMRSYFLSDEEFKNHLTLIKSHSSDAAKHIPDSSLDICFIDAGHSYEDVIRDIRTYLPKVKPGGVISGHDYDFMHDGVVNAVDEVFGSRVIVVAAGRTPCRSWKVLL